MVPEEPHSDEQDIERVQNGDTGAFRQIVTRYTPVIYSLSYRMTGDTEEAEDAVQEIFTKAYRALDTFDPSRRFFSWLYTIAVNHLRTINRKKERVPSPHVPYEETVDESVRRDTNSDAPDTTAVRREGERLAQRALDGLDPKYREVFVLRMVEGISGKETARILDLPENTVKTYLRRARKTLIEEMKNFGWE